ncbi:MAG: metalloregulator ArsR/SmtB family transcription factor [Candidatus Moranbacteria bacterium]|nr:metalloregulator ArsR/SmtB family transcription factor [Candidatus Moranbacteria bacterium]
MLTEEQLMKIKEEVAENDSQIQFIFEALGDRGRFRIFGLLMEHHELCVTEVAAVLGVTISAASQQLKILERVGLVRRVKMGQMVCYENKDEEVIQQIAQLLRVDKNNQ